MEPRGWSWKRGAVAVLTLACSLGVGTARSADDPEVVAARQALAADPEAAHAAVARLRAAGQRGVDALVAAWRQAPAVPKERFRAVLDEVCAQRDCAASRLYWYTDLPRAKAEARATGKPILALRLLGRLDEEMSCANSRFFRTVLYADPEVSSLLRQRFVLYWSSERPVPKVTIDFGDGRTLRGTVTGNSVHYLLDSRGRLLDAIPGLYGPRAFRRLLLEDEAAARRLESLEGDGWARELAGFHKGAARAIEASLQHDLAKYGGWSEVVRAWRPSTSSTSSGAGAAAPTALEASRLATSKSAVELPLLEALSPDGRAPRTTGVDWWRVAELHRDDWQLGAESRREIQRIQGELAGVPSRKAEEKVRAFERLVGIDTVRDEYLLHALVHRWLSRTEAPPSLDELNERVYRDLFLTPRSDPWLGLYSPDIFAALTPSGGEPVAAR